MGLCAGTTGQQAGGRGRGRKKEGFLVVFKFEANPELITELERVYRITDEVIKFIVVKEEE